MLSEVSSPRCAVPFNAGMRQVEDAVIGTRQIMGSN
jgi:hypothetical protein